MVDHDAWRDQGEQHTEPEPGTGLVRLDVGLAKQAFEEHFKKVLALIQEGEALQVVDDESEIRATEIGTMGKGLYNAMEKIRKQKIEEPDTYVKELNRAVKPYTDKLKDLERTMKGKIGPYQRQKEVDRLKKEKEQREAMEALNKKIEAEAKKAGVEAPDVLVLKPVAEKAGPVRTEAGSSSTRMIWTWDRENVDMTKLPEAYKKRDDAAITQAVKQGARAIPGVRIFETPDVQFRTR